MKTTDRAVLSGLFLIALLAAFYFLVLAPKRQEASKLGTDIAALEASISEQEQTVAFAEEARKSFPKYYGRMVVLGKAAPEQADSASMLVQVNSIADRSSVKFRSLALAEGGGESAGQTAAAAPPAPAAPAEGAPGRGRARRGCSGRGRSGLDRRDLHADHRHHRARASDRVRSGQPSDRRHRRAGRAADAPLQLRLRRHLLRRRRLHVRH